MKESSKYIKNNTLILENNFIKISKNSLFLSDGVSSDLFYID